MGQNVKKLKLWMIAGAIALIVVIMGRSPLSQTAALFPSETPVGGQVLAQPEAPSESAPVPENQPAPDADPAAQDASPEAASPAAPNSDMPESDILDPDPPDETSDPPESLDLESPDEAPNLDAAAASDANIYTDAAERYTIEILENFVEFEVAGAPLFESPDGAIAYTVVTQTLASEGDEALDPGQLEAVAKTTFNQGQGIQYQDRVDVDRTPDQDFDSPAIELPWAGVQTVASGIQPISGRILVQQDSGTVFLVLVAVTESGSDRQEDLTRQVFRSFTLHLS